jgi:nucleotide-binding universal stress UspA family protein
MITKILVPVDGSPHADTAVEWASALSAKFDAPLLLLHVIARWGTELSPAELRPLADVERTPVTEWDVLESLGRRIADAAAERARTRGATRIETTVELGDPAQTILEQAKTHGADLIVMGRRGLGPLPGLFLGSVSTKVLHLADCACLTVK